MVTKSKYIMTQSHKDAIKKATLKNRQAYENVEMMLDNSPKYLQLEVEAYAKRIYDKSLQDFFTNLNVLVFLRNSTNEEVSINMEIKNLEYRLGHELCDKWNDLALFITQYVKSVSQIDIDYPYPKSMSLIGTNYSTRYEEIYSLKKEAIKSLKNILEGKN